MENNLNERAMLVNLTVSMWSGRKKDRSITNEVEIAKGAESDAGSWWTYLVPKSSISIVESKATVCRAVHCKYTLPWMDGGTRILPIDMFMTYQTEMDKAIGEFKKAVNSFLDEYPQMIANAPKRLGALVDSMFLPDVEDIRQRFNVSVDYLPLPSSNDFRVKMSDEQTDAIRSKIEQNIANMTKQAVSDIWQRMYTMVEKVAEKLSDPDKIFRDSLINNLAEFCQMVPKFNILNDNNIENMRSEILKKLTNLKPDEVRENKAARKDVAKAAQDVLEKMRSYFNA